MRALRVAVAGTGFIGRVHARSIRVAGAELVGVAASSLASAERAAAALGASRAFASSEEMVEADGVDVVHICTPNDVHESLALKALAAGKHVVLEKPVALDGAGGRRIADAAAAAGLVVSVPFVYRFHPTVREARSRIAAGELGRLRLLHGSYQQDWLAHADDTNWRVEPRLGGPSRAFADIGSHWCDLVEFTSALRMTRVHARTQPVVASRTTEDVVVMMFETDAGVLGSVVVSQVSHGRKNRLWFELDGETAAVVFDQENPESLWLGRREGSAVIDRDGSQLSPEAARLVTLPAGHAQGYQDCFDNFVADTYAVIGGDARDGLPLIGDGVRAACITDAVLASARSGEWTDIEGG